ncbi:hypothetical protein OPQ81_003855 [Rhizoctonia solani]|nr:hypothetical protein OPQ81_003855 [Rhizoctonia solani]
MVYVHDTHLSFPRESLATPSTRLHCAAPTDRILHNPRSRRHSAPPNTVHSDSNLHVGDTPKIGSTVMRTSKKLGECTEAIISTFCNECSDQILLHSSILW